MRRVLISAAKTALVTAAATAVTVFIDRVTGGISDPGKAGLIVALAGVIKGLVKDWELRQLGER